MPSAHWARGLSAIGDGSLCLALGLAEEQTQCVTTLGAILSSPRGYVPLQRQDPLGSFFLFHSSFSLYAFSVHRSTAGTPPFAKRHCTRSDHARPTHVYSTLGNLLGFHHRTQSVRGSSEPHRSHCVVAASGCVREQLQTVCFGNDRTLRSNFSILQDFSPPFRRQDSVHLSSLRT